MPELFEICDKYYVLRDGCLVAEGKFEDTDEDGITELMIGRQLHDAEFENHADHIRTEVAMEAQHLSGEGFEDISFQLHKGEVLAITGLQGSGRDELADALFGVIPARGRLSFGGQTLENARNIKFHMKHGVALVPRMRKERGIHDDLSITDNMSMAFLNTKWKKLLISGRAERERFARQQKALQIKAGSRPTPSPRFQAQPAEGHSRQMAGDGRRSAFVVNPTQGSTWAQNSRSITLFWSLQSRARPSSYSHLNFPRYTRWQTPAWCFTRAG